MALGACDRKHIFVADISGLAAALDPACRLADLFITKSRGYDVESTIIEHPAVAEVPVVGKPDPERRDRQSICGLCVRATSPLTSLQMTFNSTCARDFHFTPIPEKSNSFLHCRRHRAARYSASSCGSTARGRANLFRAGRKFDIGTS
jgi:hypothetical protein